MVLRCLQRRGADRVVACTVGRDTTLVVREDARYRELVEIGAREMVHTRVLTGDPLRSGFPYTDALHAARWLAGATDRAARALCLGVGGGIVARQLEHAGAHVDAVDMSSAVLELARDHFGLRENASLAVHRADAGAFAANARTEGYDVVIIDLFGAFEASPLLARRTFFEHVRRCLRPGGAIAVNTIGALDGSSGAMFVIHRAIAAAFGELVSEPVLDARERATGNLATRPLRNVVTFATRGPLPGALPNAMPPPELPELRAVLASLRPRLAAITAATADAASDRPLRLPA